jgi:hypothetical protein
VQERLQQSATFFLSQGSDSYSANVLATGAIGGAVRRQAFLLVYGDCLILGCVLLASAAALFFMKKTKGSGAVGGH